MNESDPAPQSGWTSPYGPFARLYDRRWGRRIRDLMLPVLESLLLRHLPAGAGVLDVGCGPAWISQAVAERGFAVTALDIDADMLGLARVNAPGCRLLRADARRFRLPPVFAGALSTAGALNELPTLAEVAGMLANVHSALIPGGRFCFDCLLDSEFEGRDRPLQALVDDEFVELWRERFDAAAARLSADVTLFHLQDGGWQRCDITDCQQLYTAAGIESALVEAGFRGIRVLSAVRDLGCPDLAGRTFFVAEKAPIPGGGEVPG
jgi:SAM-dependent methyltransferase